MTNLFAKFMSVFGKAADPEEIRQHDISEGDEGIDDAIDAVNYDETF